MIISSCHTHTCMHVHSCTLAHMNTHTHTCARACTHMHTRTRVHACTHTHACTLRPLYNRLCPWSHVTVFRSTTARHFIQRLHWNLLLFSQVRLVILDVAEEGHRQWRLFSSHQVKDAVPPEWLTLFLTLMPGWVENVRFPSHGAALFGFSFLNCSPWMEFCTE